MYNPRIHMDLTPKMTVVKEADFQSLASLHARDIVWLVAVIMGVKPMATLVIPLEVQQWFQQFSDRHSLISFEDGPSDSHQARVAVCPDEETAESRKALKRIRSLVDEVARDTAISRENEAYRGLTKALTRLEGVTFGYPNCCIEFHAGKGPSSRAKVYEEFLESGRDQSIPVEFWAVAHAPCSPNCTGTLELGRRYLDALASFSERLRDQVEQRLLLPRFYQTGGGRFIELQPLDYDPHEQRLSVSKEKFEMDARQHLPEPITEITLCEVPKPYVLVEATESPPCKTSFPNPDMIGTMWLAYTSGCGAYMVNAKNGQLALYITSDQWIPKVGEEWRSKSNFRIYRSSLRGSSV